MSDNQETRFALAHLRRCPPAAALEHVRYSQEEPLVPVLCRVPRRPAGALRHSKDVYLNVPTEAAPSALRWLHSSISHYPRGSRELTPAAGCRGIRQQRHWDKACYFKGSVRNAPTTGVLRHALHRRPPRTLCHPRGSRQRVPTSKRADSLPPQPLCDERSWRRQQLLSPSAHRIRSSCPRAAALKQTISGSPQPFK